MQTASTPDALLTTLTAYRAACAAYNGLPFDITDQPGDPAVELTYGPSYSKLCHWSEPATSAKAALAALQEARDDIHFLSGLSESMFDAVVGFLKTIA